MRKVRASVTIDLDTGEYELMYNNISKPGEEINYSEMIRYLKAIFAKNEKDVLKDADTGTTGQAKRDKDEMN